MLATDFDKFFNEILGTFLHQFIQLRNIKLHQLPENEKPTIC